MDPKIVHVFMETKRKELGRDGWDRGHREGETSLLKPERSGVRTSCLQKEEPAHTEP